MKRSSFVLSLLLLAVTISAKECLICSQCVDCTPEVMADPYLDKLDALLQKNIKEMGYPLHIKRTVS